jgi:hypothetical protein
MDLLLIRQAFAIKMGGIFALEMRSILARIAYVLVLIVCFWVVPQSQALGQIRFRAPKGYQCKDRILTINGSVINCRLDAVVDTLLYYSMPTPNKWTTRTMGPSGVLVVAPGERRSVKILEHNPYFPYDKKKIKELLPMMEEPKD